MIGASLPHTQLPELLAPAGSPEALVAAVQSGATGVYLAYGDFNARRNAKNFSAEDFSSAVSYCHLRGARVFLTLNTLVSDRELQSAYDTAAFAASCGVDAVIVQDVGLFRALREGIPDLCLHGSTQMTVHNLPGLRLCAQLGLSRVVLARELSKDAISYLAQQSPVELETFLHGALCLCYSGQCYFSGLLGGRSGNRGLCAQPCRLSYRRGGEEQPTYPLSLKDLSLADHLGELSQMGIACLKIEGRMKRAEYVAVVTKILSDCLNENRRPTKKEKADLTLAFSRKGFTDAYFTGEKSPRMFGYRPEGTALPEDLFAAARERYQRGEERFVPITMTAAIIAGEPSLLFAADEDGREVCVEGIAAEPARSKALTEEEVSAQLSKTGGTVFSCREVFVSLGDSLSLPRSALNALRRDALAALEKARLGASAISAASYAALSPIVAERAPAKGTPPVFVSLASFGQISDALLRRAPKLLTLPVEALCANEEALRQIMAEYPNVMFAVTLPRVFWDAEIPALTDQLRAIRAMGIDTAYGGTWGSVQLSRELGFSIRGDFGLGLFNSRSLQELAGLGLSAATASFELNFSQIRDLKKPLPTELIAYGRLPLMLSEACLGAGQGDCKACPDKGICQPTALTDRKGVTFPVVPTFGRRWEMLNGKTLYLADKDLSGLGVSALRLLFTTETAADCADILRRYQDGSPPPEGLDFTRGLYLRKLE